MPCISWQTLQTVEMPDLRIKCGGTGYPHHTNAVQDGLIHITLEVASECIQKRVDASMIRHGDSHYDTISAFIKSMRGSDPDAAVYYLAKMLYAGEDM